MKDAIIGTKIGVVDDETSSGVEKERIAIISALKIARGNKTEVARILGISRPTLYRRMKRHDL